jgi:hypothetical protein
VGSLTSLNLIGLHSLLYGDIWLLNAGSHHLKCFSYWILNLFARNTFSEINKMIIYKLKDTGPGFHSIAPESQYLSLGLLHFSKSNIRM